MITKLTRKIHDNNKLPTIIKSITLAKKNTTKVLNEILENVIPMNDINLNNFLEGLKSVRSIANALGGEMFYRFYKNGENINIDEINKIQRIGFLSIRFVRISDNIIDLELNNIEKQREFIYKYLDELKGNFFLDIANIKEAKIKGLVSITRKLSDEVINYENNLFIDVYSILADYVSSELDHKSIPQILIPELNSIINEVYNELDNFNFTEEEIISLKIAIGIGAFTGGIILPLTLMDLNKEEDIIFLKNMFFIGGSMQLFDDICDVNDDIIEGKKSFATKSNSNDLGKFKELQEHLYNKGFDGLSEYQKGIMSKFNRFYSFYTKINWKLK